MIYILHGRASSPRRAWRPWLKAELESRHYEVVAPQLPFAAFPSPKKWEKALESLVEGHESNTFIAHSLSTQTVLRYMASGKGTLSDNMFLVAPFQEVDYNEVYRETISMTDGKPLPKFMKKKLAELSVRNSHIWCDVELPWEQLKPYQDNLHFFFSKTDHYVQAGQIDLFKSKLPDASYHVEENAGHFNTAAGYTQFPLLLEVVVKVLGKVSI
jgi:predicted alpha/beta hydrolase family esterase